MVTALYRRYRPETFAEMIGQAQVTEPLMTALRSSKIGHAYLFSGPRGCGKTTSARILARCLNCHQGPTDTPCGTCPSCIELGREGGGSLDVIEIDAASHGGVDDARELRERAIFAPARDKFKIFIIDEAHMVSSQGFNALLKIVEEPPEHVKFIFATTEPEKVIGTIRSRTHHFPFRLVAPAPLLDYTAKMCAEEGMQVEDGVLSLIIRAGGGSVRDTLSILDQLIAGSENACVTYDLAVGLLGYTPEDLLDEIINALGDTDAAAAVKTIDSVIQSGQDPRRFVEDLLERLRDLIIAQATDASGVAAVLRGLSEEQLARLLKQATKFTELKLSKTADIVSQALDKMTGASAPRLQLELMIARILTLGSQVTDSQKVVSEVTRVDPHSSKTLPVSVATPAEFSNRSLVAPKTQTTVPGDPTTQQNPEIATGTTKPASTPSEPASTGVTYADAARNARAFLAGDVRQVTEPGQITDAASTVEMSAAPAISTESTFKPESVARPEPGVSAVGNLLFDLPGINNEWVNILKQLRDIDPEAESVAKKIKIVSAGEEKLVIGFFDPRDLADFKRIVATPLREIIIKKFGSHFSYIPKQLDKRQLPVPEYLQTEPAVMESTVVQPATLKPAVYETQLPPESTVHEQLVPEPPAPDPDFESYYDAEPDPLAESLAQPEQQQVSQEPRQTSHEPQQVAPKTSEKIVRYGESVVREQLGAKFIKEVPLTKQTEN